MVKPSLNITRLFLLIVLLTTCFVAGPQGPAFALSATDTSQSMDSGGNPTGSPLAAEEPGLWECVGLGLPDPCRNTLNAVDMLSSEAGWAVGEGGTILRWLNGAWEKVASPTRSALKAVDMVSTSAGWAVGEGGAILHWNGSAWAQVASPTTRTLHAVKMLSTTEGYAAGEWDTLLRWNGSAWSTAYYGDNPYGGFRALDVTGTNSVWVAGRNGVVNHWNGSSWDVLSGVSTTNLYAIDFLSATEGWVAGAGVVYRYLNGAWTDYSLPQSVYFNDYYSIQMISSTDGWITGRYLSHSGYAFHWDGTAWTPIAGPTIFNCFSLSMTSAASGWAVGEGGQILRYAGGTWQVTSSPQHSFLLSVSMLSATEGRAVGSGPNGPVITRWDGTAWTNEPLPELPYLRGLTAIQMVSSTEGWAVGEEGQILRWNQGFWSSSYSGYGGFGFSAVEQVSASDVWVAASYSGNINPNVSMLHWNGTSWGSVSTPAKATLYALEMVASDDGWAVGNGGSPALIHWDGNAWNAHLDSSISGWAIDMISSSDGWITGDNFYHWNGTTWSPYPYPTDPNSGFYPRAINMVGHDDVWAVGTFGTTFHWDGINWSSVASQTANHLHSISKGADGTLWAVGDYGVTLRYSGHGSLPVILLPGIMGSRLYNDKSSDLKCALRSEGEIWLDFSNFFNPLGGFSTLYLQPDGITPANQACDRIYPSGIFDGGVKDAYSGLIYALNQSGYQVISFSYDWRLNLEDGAEKLYALIQSQRLGKVVLVGHSMGGLLARVYVDDPDRAATVDKVISVGSPYWGAPKAALTMRSGLTPIEFAIGQNNFVVTMGAVAEIARNSPGSMQLLPSDAYFAAITADASIPDGYYQYTDSAPFPNFTDTRNFFTSNPGKMGTQNGVLMDQARAYHQKYDVFSSTDIQNTPYFILATRHKYTPFLVREYPCSDGNSPDTCFAVSNYLYGDDTVPYLSAAVGEPSGSTASVTFFGPGEVKLGHGDLMLDPAIIQAVKNILAGLDPKPAGSRLAAEDAPAPLIQVAVWGGAQVSVRDSANHYLGLDENGAMINEIEGSSYAQLENFTDIALPSGRSYTVTFQEQGSNPLLVKVTDFRAPEVESAFTAEQSAVFIEAPSQPGGSASLQLDYSSGLESLHLVVDLDGDGAPDHVLLPSSILDAEGCRDYTMPTTGILVDGQTDRLGYPTGPVTISLSATDAGSGVYKTEYSLDKGLTWQEYALPVLLVAEETPVFYARSIDRAGNSEYPWARLALRPFLIHLPVIRSN